VWDGRFVRSGPPGHALVSLANALTPINCQFQPSSQLNRTVLNYFSPLPRGGLRGGVVCCASPVADDCSVPLGGFHLSRPKVQHGGSLAGKLSASASSINSSSESFSSVESLPIGLLHLSRRLPYLLCGITCVKPATETVMRKRPSVRLGNGRSGVYWKRVVPFGGISPGTV
jgi:hypothetical protein